jgi:hypothetical protein
MYQFIGQSTGGSTNTQKSKEAKAVPITGSEGP